MRLLFIGDIVGNKGTEAVVNNLALIKKEFRPQLTIANGENSTSVGRGISKNIYKELMGSGVDVITLGNHAWNNAEIVDFIDDATKLIRPANFPGKDVPGKGYVVVNVNGIKVGIINLQGRIFLNNLDDPFTLADEIIDKLKAETDIIFVDFHAEATSEKLAFATYVTGRVSAVVGTHTHVQTNDARILNKYTAFLTDAGMSGPTDGILGMHADNIIQQFINQRPTRFKVEETGPTIISGCYIDVDNESGKAQKIKTFKVMNDQII
ncbi:TIGR00282 family metallophosphoesterase [Lentilactobacillus laojiaonis]|uniref:TIGR00282 family metallophosphoesterase n=1 Tax=Lentilactobacillus laojiaonis TaxID=2883998 RepID=UPI001D0AF8B8|nr:TIGR00282 family metallophosphoesterase [Lentilactobacillus laojiaonis]UDM31716.1 TIGR00282 family metallophosphoesterase [Lentilactobacillus laojiaonis]